MENYRPEGMSLSALGEKFDLQIVRDGRFLYAGKIPTLLPDRLVPLGGRKYLNELRRSQGVSAVLATPDLADDIPDQFAVASCTNPLEMLFKIHSELCGENYYWGPAREPVIGENTAIHPTAQIAGHDIVIGNNVRIEENAIIRPHTIIGDDSLIGPGAILGCEGFQTAFVDGRQILQPQSGGVKIGRGTSILAMATITRATFGGFTAIGDEVVIDNLTQIAHDVVIGNRTRVAAGSVVSGRATIGEKVYIAPNATISNGVQICDGAKITLGSVVINNVAQGETVTGNFAVNHLKFMKDLAKRFMV